MAGISPLGFWNKRGGDITEVRVVPNGNPHQDDYLVQ